MAIAMTGSKTSSLRAAGLLFVLSVCPSWRPSTPTQRRCRGMRGIDFFALVRVHFQRAADAVLVPLVTFGTGVPVLSVPEYTRK
jgi:hypothetical protein